MLTLNTRPQPAENQLLAPLPCEERLRLHSLMQTVPLQQKQAIHRPGEAIQSVYFPLDAVLSLVSILENGSCTEVGSVGKEGVAGLPAQLGAGSEPFELMVLVPGTARRMRAEALGAEASRCALLQDELERYMQAFVIQIAQTVACARHHVVERRLATSLLMTRDRIESDRLPMTHESLGNTLGVGRPSVTLAAAALREAGLIRYHRGAITITDRQGLEEGACECYRVMRDEYDRLLV